MSFYRDYIYPRLVDKLGDPAPIQEIRRQIIPLAEGKVLEIGVGSGTNFSHYEPARVSKLYALEPNLGMIKLAEIQQRKTKLNIGFLDLPGEHIPLEDCTMDTVVSTFTVDTIPAVAEAIRGIARVLKPDGKLIFFELGLLPDPDVQRWQKRLELLCPQSFLRAFNILHIYLSVKYFRAHWRLSSMAELAQRHRQLRRVSRK